MDTREWRAGQKRRQPPPRQQVTEAEAEALWQVEQQRRQAEQAAERARLEAELAAEKARRDAYVDGLYDELETESLWLNNSPGNGHGDVKRIKF
jgi:hypothetical protein